MQTDALFFENDVQNLALPTRVFGSTGVVRLVNSGGFSINAQKHGVLFLEGGCLLQGRWVSCFPC